MSINKDIPELLNAGVITEKTADKLRGYYKSKDVAPPKTSALNYRLMVVFGILGAILIGLGIILIIALCSRIYVKALFSRRGPHKLSPSLIVSLLRAMPSAGFFTGNPFECEG